MSTHLLFTRGDVVDEHLFGDGDSHLRLRDEADVAYGGLGGGGELYREQLIGIFCSCFRIEDVQAGGGAFL